MMLIGQGPHGRDQEEFDLPLTGDAGKRLAAMAGWTLEQLHAHYEVVNLLSTWYGKAGKGDAFPPAVAREAAARMRVQLVGVPVIIVGVGVARAFGLEPQPYCEWRTDGLLTFAVIPHPSGVNRAYNDPAMKEKVGSFIRANGGIVTYRPPSRESVYGH